MYKIREKCVLTLFWMRHKTNDTSFATKQANIKNKPRTMDSMPKLTKTIEGTNFYASNRTYLQYLNNLLRDLGISDAGVLPAFDSDGEKSAAEATLHMRNKILALEPLVYQIDAHKSIIEQCSAGALDLSPAQQAYHRNFIANNESQVFPYCTANLTPVDLINKKIKTLTILQFKLTPSPWENRMTLRPDLSPIIAGNISLL